MRSIKVKTEDKIFVFNVQTNGSAVSGDLKVIPYRIIAIPSGATLYKLAEAITDSFDFSFDHCFGFYDDFKNPFQSKIGFELFADIGEESKFPGVKKTKINEAFHDTGNKLLFYFDYGDVWFFPIELIEIRDIGLNKKYPLILEKVGESPEQYPPMDEDEIMEDEDDSIEIILTLKERDMILNHTFTGDDLTERLNDSPEVNGKILVHYDSEELEDLIGYVAAEANHAKGKKIENEPNALCGKLEGLLEGER